MDGSVNSGGSLESTVTWTCYMNHDDTLADEVEDATEEDNPHYFVSVLFSANWTK
jgi:hypothetical protein